MTTQTLTALRQLKLGGMANALQSQLEQIGTYEGLAFTKRLALLVEQECLSRDTTQAGTPDPPGALQAGLLRAGHPLWGSASYRPINGMPASTTTPSPTPSWTD